MCVHTCVYVCVHVHMCAHMYIHICVHCICVYMLCMCVHVCVYVCVHVRMCVFRSAHGGQGQLVGVALVTKLSCQVWQQTSLLSRYHTEIIFEMKSNEYNLP